MSPRTMLGALLLILLTAVPSPAAAKGPTQVEVRNLSTGSVVMLTWEREELMALMELVEWPQSRSRPRGVQNGSLTHVATLDWQLEDGHAVWLDRVFSDGEGTAWVARRDHLMGNDFVTWGRVRAPFALDLLVEQLGRAEPAETAQAQQVTPEPAVAAQTASASRASWFGLGAAAAVVVLGGLSLLLRRRSSPA
jgi:hypothetical protein